MVSILPVYQVSFIIIIIIIIIIENNEKRKLDKEMIKTWMSSVIQWKEGKCLIFITQIKWFKNVKWHSGFFFYAMSHNTIPWTWAW